MTTLRFILYDIADSDKIFIMTSNSYKGGGKVKNSNIRKESNRNKILKCLGKLIRGFTLVSESKKMGWVKLS